MLDVHQAFYNPIFTLYNTERQHFGLIFVFLYENMTDSIKEKRMNER